jgi:hypothetical protein
LVAWFGFYDFLYCLVYLSLLIYIYIYYFLFCLNFYFISIQKLINIDRRKLVEILVLILKEVIDRFIWTIELKIMRDFITWNKPSKMGDVVTLLFVHFNFIIQLRNMFFFLKSIHIAY